MMGHFADAYVSLGHSELKLRLDDTQYQGLL